MADPSIYLYGSRAIRKHLRSRGIQISERTLYDWRKRRGFPVERPFNELVSDPGRIDEWLEREFGARKT